MLANQMPKSAQPNWNPAKARELLGLACQMVGVEYERLQLLRFGTNAVYRLLPTDYVIRIARPGADASRIARELDLAVYLEQVDFPAFRVAGELSLEPLKVMDATVTFWRWLEHKAGQRPTPPQFGELLRDFHRVSSSYTGYLPGFAPLSFVAEDLTALAAASHLSTQDFKLLWHWQRKLDERLDGVTSRLGFGPLHGDAHLGNALLSDGQAVIIDFEHLCRGPREWDLIPAALDPRRFGGSEPAYQEFAAAYGTDVTQWEHFELFSRIRELQTTTWRLRVDMTARVQDESERRMQYWRGVENPPAWHAF